MKVIQSFKKLFSSPTRTLTPRATVAELRGERTLAVLRVHHAGEAVKNLEASESPWGPESQALTEARGELKSAKTEVKLLTKEIKSAEKHARAGTAEWHRDGFEESPRARAAAAPTLPASPPPPVGEGTGRSRLTRGR